MIYVLLLQTDDVPIKQRKHDVEKSIHKRKMFKCWNLWLKFDID